MQQGAAIGGRARPCKFDRFFVCVEGLTAVSGRTTNWTRSIRSPSRPRTYRRSHEVTLHPSGLKERTRLDYLICSCNESGGIDARGIRYKGSKGPPFATKYL